MRFLLCRNDKIVVKTDVTDSQAKTQMSADFLFLVFKAPEERNIYRNFENVPEKELQRSDI